MKLPKISDKNLYLNTVKRNFPMTLLFFVGMFIAFDVSAVMSVSNANDMLHNRYYNYNISVDYYISAFGSSFGVLAELVCLVCAAFAGCIAIKHLMNKRSAALFGSIPCTRTKQLASSCLAGVTSFAIPYVITVVLMMCIFAVSGFGGSVPLLIPYVLKGVMWFFFFYALVIAVGMLCGMTSIQVLGVGTVLAYLPAMVVMLVLFGERFYTNIDFEYYLTDGTMNYSSPIVRFVTDFGTNMAWYDIAAYIIATGVLFVAALLLYKARDNSKAGQPIVFDKIIPVIKYLIMILSALVGGIFFAEANSGSIFWLIVGCILGVLVSYMLMNVILYKNARAFFAKPKGLAVFCAVFAVIFVFFAFDPIGMDDYMPGVNGVSSVSISLGTGSSYKFVERDNVEAAYKIISDCRSDWDKYYSSNSGDYFYYNTVTVVTKWGVPYRFPVYARNISEYREEYKTLYNSDELMKGLKKAVKYEKRMSAHLYTMTYSSYEYESMLIETEYEVKEFFDIFLEESGGVLIRDDKGPVIAGVDIGEYTVPLYLDYTESMKYLRAHQTYRIDGIVPTRDNISSFLSAIKCITVTEDGKTTVYTEKEDIERIYLSSVGFDNDYCVPDFMADPDKNAVIETHGSSYYDSAYESSYGYEYRYFDLLLY